MPKICAKVTGDQYNKLAFNLEYSKSLRDHNKIQFLKICYNFEKKFSPKIKIFICIFSLLLLQGWKILIVRCLLSQVHL